MIINVKGISLKNKDDQAYKKLPQVIPEQNTITALCPLSSCAI
jgi:hypothetical protein